jgi:hypothetical protein
MDGPPLTSYEVVRLVRRKVRQFEDLGLPRDAAVLATANALRVEPHKIEALNSEDLL